MEGTVIYSGTTLHRYSGMIMGAHQKIDRVAYKHLQAQIQGVEGFPKLRDILHFEGNNGPDGIKRKSPARDEPSHFYDPFDEDDTNLLEQISYHYDELVRQLKRGALEKAAFESSWLAHAVVDGLTPAHHFPYEQKLLEIRGGNQEMRKSIREKLIMPGASFKESLQSNWAMWGIGGLLSMHGFFEIGVAAAIATLRFPTARPSDGDIQTLVDVGYKEYFMRTARQIALLDLYERFCNQGWRPKLLRDVRNELAPAIIKTVTLIWYSALRDAGMLKGKNH